MTEPEQTQFPRPYRTEPRGAFPVHAGPGPDDPVQLTAADAAARAEQRLADWRRDNGRRD